MRCHASSCPQCERLAGGMSKIAEASIELHELNAKLAVQKVVVAEKTLACETLLGEIMDGEDSAAHVVANGTAEMLLIIHTFRVAYTFINSFSSIHGLPGHPTLTRASTTLLLSGSQLLLKYDISGDACNWSIVVPLLHCYLIGLQDL
jgi:hypothetical protein